MESKAIPGWWSCSLLLMLTVRAKCISWVQSHWGTGVAKAAVSKKELSSKIMIICSTVRKCCCQGLLRVHESLRNTLPAFTPMQCHSECSLEMCPPFNQALTHRIGNAQEGEEERGGGGVALCLLAGLTWRTDWDTASVGVVQQRQRHTDGCSVLTPVLPPDTHHTLSELHWGCDVCLAHDITRGNHLINESIVIVLPAPHPDTQITI